MSNNTDDIDALCAELGLVTNELTITEEEKVLTPSQRYYQANKERLKAKSAEWRQVNKDKVRANSRIYTEKNRDRICAYQRVYRVENKERVKKSMKDWARKNQKYIKNNHYVRNYGITFDQYNDMLVASNGLCCYCERPFNHSGSKRPIQVDHCHKTGRVRGLACHTCNVGLGHFNDDPDLMFKVASALRKLNRITEES